ncbi:non-ribosomal peptide synthetase [Paenibacillus sp. SYP-B4298]|uniref:non-ribosomal peptide synthetase n=1 Tax=Paenibacillus sp. SYP-B4298 TaxID=2996034 RepID=UPI0022DD7A43|nr:non-ribosomal peptide synthetase [Paenibacillus sp. SYP-B4298]
MSDMNARMAALSPEQRELLMRKLEERKTAARPSPLPRPLDSEGVELSYAQQRLWLLDQLDSGTSHYNIPYAVRLSGALHQAVLQDSLTEIIRRHGTLRTRFVEREGKARQLVDPVEEGWSFPLARADAQAEGGDVEEAALRLANSEAARPFDLAVGPLLRGLLIQLGEQDHVLLITFHHIVFDGWSLQIFQQELWQLYACTTAGLPSPLPALPIQYTDYAIWQRERLSEAGLKQQLDYWRGKLQGADHVLELPSDRPRPALQTFNGDIVSVPVEESLIQPLRELSRKEGASLFMTLLAAFKALLFRYTGKQDILVGTPVANRGLSEIEGLIGFFVNTLVLRSELEGGMSFRELLHQVRQTALDAYSHQDVPFERLVDALQPGRAVSHSPLFQVMFTLDEDSGVTGEPVEGGEFSVEPFALGSRSAKFDLTLMMLDTGTNGMIAQMEYNSDLFDTDTIIRMLDHLCRLLAAAAARPDQPIAKLPMLGEQELHTLLTERNQTACDAPADVHCVHGRIAEWAEQQPDAPAVVDGGGVLTYRELNARANQLAHHLRQLGVKEETVVGVLADRSAAQVTALLAIMKAGGAYLPIDPAYPTERAAYMLEESGAAVLLAEQRLLKQAPATAATVIELDDVQRYAGERSDVAPAGSAQPEQLAYVIFTSGSTGKPKGVQIEHRGLLNLIHWHQRAYGLTASDRTTLYAGPAFDASVWELWPTLTAGAALYIPDPELRADPVGLRDWMVRHGVTVSFLPTPMAEAVLSLDWPADCPLRQLLTGGDRLRHYPSGKLPFGLVNHYGPTEATVVALAGAVAPVAVHDSRLQLPSIGRPIDNTLIYVLDERMQPVPDGVSGELYIGGAGLARGYIGQPQLTAERFVPHPFRPGERLYRTGDMVRYLRDGTLAFLGRKDDQVSIRGYRIELGEIEQSLAEHPSVQEAVILVKEGQSGASQLVAYVVPAACSSPQSQQAADDAAIHREEWRAYLRSRLPEYMIPSAFVMLERMPVTANGKVDRRALPEAELPDEMKVHTPPRTDKEQTLADVWAEVLGVSPIGIHDNFFELGGDSILSIQIVSRCRARGLQLTPKQLFRYQTIAELAPEISLGAAVEAEQGMVSGSAPLVPIQRWFFEQPWQSPHHFNQSMMFCVHPSLTLDHLRAVVERLLAHHDALRARFVQEDGVWEQSYADAVSHDALISIDLSGIPAEQQQEMIERQAAEAQRQIALDAGMLLRAVHFDLGPGQIGRLLLVIHHLGVDGVSWRIIMEDLERIGQGVLEGHAIQLPPKTTAYRDWAGKLAAYATGDKLQSDATYWLSGNWQEVSGLPVDHVTGHNTVESSRDVVTELSASRTQQLLQEVPAVYRTQINDLLLAALLRTVSSWSGNARLLLHMEGHGREELFAEADVSRTVGWFTSMYPVLLEASGAADAVDAADVAQSIKSVKEQLRRIPRNGIGYSLLRYMNGNERAKQLDELPKPQLSFNYLGQFDQVLTTKEDRLFAQAPESTGAEQDEREQRLHLIDLTGLVAGGTLRMTWTYSEHRHERASIVRLAERYMQELEQLIAHCLQPSSGGVTPTDFPLAKLSQPQLDRLLGDGRGVEDVYPLSPMQQGMLFHTAYEPGSPAYFEQMSWVIQGDFHPDAMEQAWKQAAARHAVLRTAFFWEELDAPHQVVYRHAVVPVERRDWRMHSEAEREAMIEAWLLADRRQGFDLERAPLMRMAIIRLTEDSHYFLWSYHHLLLDGWSMNALIAEVLQGYHAAVEGSELTLGALRPYRDYIEWLQQQDMERAKRYWQELLQGFAEPTPLPGQLAAGGAEPGEHCTERLAMSSEATEQLHSFTRRHQLTASSVIQGAWALLLSLYGGGKDIVFGSTVSGRPAELDGVESMMGIFINTLPVRIAIPEQQTVLAWLREVQSKQAEQREYEYSPLQMIQGCSSLGQGVQLFDSLVVFENYPASAAGQQADDGGGLSIGSMYLFEQTNYPLTLLAVPGDPFELALTYDPARLSTQAAKRMLNHLASLVGTMCTDGGQHVSSLALLSDQEQEQLNRWNMTDAEYPLEQCIHQLIEQQAQRTPQLPAIICGEQTWSYAELDARANQLARYLQRLGVGPETIVGVCLERSLDMALSLLAIMKAGGAYLPIDPDYPHDRIAFMLEDSGMPLVLSVRGLSHCLPEPSRTLCLDELQAAIAAESAERLADGTDLETASETGIGTEEGTGANSRPSRPSPDHMCYVIYTSGSTGRPKGVVNIHRAVVNRLLWMQERYALTAEDRVLQKTPFSFDVSVWEFFWPLITGAALVLAAPGGHRDSAYLRDLIVRERISVIHFVPSMLQAFLEEEEIERCASIRHVMCSGEALPYPSQERFFARMDAELHNLYGPTEAAIDVTHWTCCRDSALRVVPIGVPIANIRIYILDEQLRPVPVGVPGELHIGGIGLARGYLNQPKLTAERFIRDPFDASGASRLYKTGDLARYMEDGVIEYLGRIDHQVKIRGFRIELGEIEAVLASHPAVREAAVIARELAGGHKQLAAYVARVQGEPIDSAELSQFLREKLPDYMVPASYTFLDAMPLSPNGKLDRKALPAPQTGQMAEDKPLELPRTELERQLAGIWSDVLGVKQVGVHDNYFELGGDSILSLQMVSRARQAGIYITPKLVFEQPTIARLAASAVWRHVQAEQGEVIGEVVLTPVQHWFFEREMEHRDYWNQSMLLSVATPVDRVALEAAMAKLIRQHDALRLRFERKNGEWRQWSEAAQDGSILEYQDLSGLTEQDRHTAIVEFTGRLQAGLNLSDGPLMRAALLESREHGFARLFIVIHHLAVDAVSWRILAEDLEAAYGQIMAGHQVQLPTKTTSYQQYAARLAQYAQAVEVRQELEHWRTLAEPLGINLPWQDCSSYAEAASRNTADTVRSVSAALSAEETRALLQEVPSVYRTQINDVLLTALMDAYYQWTGLTQLQIDMEGHGREELFDDVDVSRTVGWFTSIYPVRLQAVPGEEPGSSLKRVKEELRRIPRRGTGYGLLRYLCRDSEASRWLSTMPESVALFNYLGQSSLSQSQGDVRDAWFAPAYEETALDSSSSGLRRYLIEIAAMVTDGCFHAGLLFSEQVFREEEMSKLAELYVQSLRDIIAHCRSVGAGGVTPSDFPLVSITSTRLDQLYRQEPHLQDLYPLTPMQTGMLFHSLAEPHSGIYCEQSCFTLKGAFQRDAFVAAWARVWNRHPVLYSRVEWEGLEQPVLVLAKEAALPIVELDWSKFTSSEQETKLEQYLLEDREQGFDFSQAPLMRFALIRRDKQTVSMVWTFHHLLLDGWSNPIVIQEFFALYEAICSGRELELASIRPYRDYIGWLQQQDRQAAATFWQTYLSGVEGPTALPASEVRGAKGFAEAARPLSVSESAQLNQFARSHQLTLNTLVQGAWALLLSRWSGEADVVFGATVSGRPAELEGVETMVGLFINTLPVRVRVKSGTDVVSYLRELQEEQSAKQVYEYAALSEIQSWSDVPQGTPLFESLIVYENYPIQTTVTGGASEAAASVELEAEAGASVEQATQVESVRGTARSGEMPGTAASSSAAGEAGGQAASEESAEHDGLQLVGVQAYERTNYPLTLSVLPGEELELQLGYETDRLDEQGAAELLQRLSRLLLAMAEQPECAVTELPWLEAAELTELLESWNATLEALPERCVHELIAEQAAATPDAPALIAGEEQLTYRELEERSNQVAHYLRRLGAGPEVLVGLCAERTSELAIGLLGILKAGAAYVPIDASYPAERIAYMLADTKLPLLVTQSAVAARLPEHHARAVCLDAEREQIAAEATTVPKSGVKPEHAAYVIYTSGSTGQPKGVVITHGSLLNHNVSAGRLYELSSSDRVLQMATISFDAAVEEIFPTWLHGGTLVMPRERLLGVREFTELIESERVSVLNLATAYWQEWSQSLSSGEVKLPGSVRAVIIGGERPSPAQYARWQEMVQGRVSWYNTYGPTETTVISTAFRAPEERAAYEEVPIGRPIANTEVYVLDAHRQPVPVGVAGELYIGGRGLARGYLNKPELTEAVFVAHPFRPGARLYRTGDLVRYRTDGQLEYVGRLDGQVKLRGYRIELEEVEGALASQPGVKQAVAAIRAGAGGEKRLIAYAVAQEQGETGTVSESELRQSWRKALEEQLPAYMVPSVIVLLERLPLTASGKIDRKALPQPELTESREYTAPRNAVEAQLCQLWAQALGVSRVGIHDNFFELGGDSIVSIQIVSRAGQAGLKLTPKQMFEHQTVAGLAAVAKLSAPVIAEQGPVTGDVLLTPIQHWFFEQEIPSRHHWNQAMLLAIRQPVDARAIRQSLALLSRHHDALRLRYAKTEEGWRQTIAAPDESVPVTRLDLSGLEQEEQTRRIEEEAQRLQQSLALENGPIMRAAVFDLGAGQPARLLLIIHHLAVDGVSWRILMEDLQTAYSQALQGEPLTLPDKTTSFQAWARRLHDYAQSPAMQEERTYWLQEERLRPLPLPLDGDVSLEAVSAVNTYADAQSIMSVLDAEATTALLQEMPPVYRTRINDLLMTALARALAAWTGEKRVRIHLEEHGREDLFDDVDLSRTVGWFTTVHPVLLALDGDGSLERDLKGVKEQLRSIPHKGIGYGLLRYLNGHAETAQQLEHVESPGILFNYLGQMDQMAQESGWISGAPESSGQPHHPDAPRDHLIEINGGVSGGQLILNWTFSSRLHRVETIERLAAAFVQELRVMIDHCRLPHAGGVTPSDFPLLAVSQEQLDRLYASDRHIRDLYPLSPLQEGMLYHSLARPDAGIYCEQSCLTLSGAFNRQAFEQAWRELLRRHSGLRVRIELSGFDQPLQSVSDEVRLPIVELDWSEYTSSEQETKLEQYLLEDREQGFDFSQAPLMRFALIRRDKQTVSMVWTFHHLLLDGWSNPIVIQEFFALYEAICSGRELELASIRPYRDYIGWLQQQDRQAAATFWQTYLSGVEGPTALPASEVRGAKGFAEAARPLSVSESAQLNQFARSHQLTLNTLVQGAWALLLSRWSGEADVVFGATVSGRPAELEGVETMVGLFINTLPVRVRVKSGTDVVSYLRELQEEQSAKQVYEYAALSEIQSWSDVPQGTPLFESLIVYENYPIQTTVTGGASEAAASVELEAEAGASVEQATQVESVRGTARSGEMPGTAASSSAAGEAGGQAASEESAEHDGLQLVGVQAYERTNYPLTLSVLPGEELELQLGYETDRLDEQGAAELLQRLSRLLLAMAEQPECAVTELPWLEAAELTELLESWNATLEALPERCVHELIAEQAAATPDAPALIAGEEQLTYRELEERSNQVAHYLRRLGAGPEVLVGLCAERTSELAIGLLGILKAGAAYVPIDASYPAERIAYMLADTKLPLLVTQSAVAARLPEHHARAVCLDAEREQIAAEATTVPKSGVKPEHAAYVIYTSGSTGQPKGVVITHGSLLNHNVSAGRLYELSSSDRVLQMATISFDAAVEEIFPTWLHGGTLVMPRERLLGVREFTELIESERVSVLNLATAYWQEWSQSLSSGEVKLPGSVRAVIIGGERPSPAQYARWQEMVQGRVSWYNTYGPTETTVISTAFRAPEERAAYEEVPIGRPIANTEVYVLDAHRQPVPVGVAGELYIGGRGLARGYLNKPELTEAVFVAHPFRPGARLYRTGDLVRYRTDGQLEYVGRLDGQVKLRGYRIELEEVEGALASQPGVKQAVAAIRAGAGGEKRLIAYAVAQEQSGTGAASEQELRQSWRKALEEQLPAYMVPSAIVLLERLPLTASGKIDRKALPQPELTESREYTAPRNVTELRLMQLFEEQLELSEIGIHDSFYALGGHSLLAIRLVMRIKQEFGSELPVSLVLEKGTVAELARVLMMESPAAPFNPLVTLQPHGSRPPLFFVHPAGGLVLAYMSLAKLLGPDQPFHAFQSRALDGMSTGTIEEVARDYIEQLRSAHPGGPYRLGGWSIGGTIAYEMARQLTLEGAEVEQLFLLDTPARYDTEDEELELSDAELWSRLIDIPLAEVRQVEPEEQLAALLEEAKTRGVAADEMSTANAEALVRIYRELSAATRSYEPEGYSGALTLIRVDDPGSAGGEPSMGWEELALQGVDVRYVSGEHHTMMDSPHVEAVAQHMQDVLQQ